MHWKCFDVNMSLVWEMFIQCTSAYVYMNNSMIFTDQLMFTLKLLNLNLFCKLLESLVLIKKLLSRCFTIHKLWINPCWLYWIFLMQKICLKEKKLQLLKQTQRKQRDFTGNKTLTRVERASFILILLSFLMHIFQ